MPLVTTKEMLQKAYVKGYAVGAFNVDNVDILKAVFKWRFKIYGNKLYASND